LAAVMVWGPAWMVMMVVRQRQAARTSLRMVQPVVVSIQRLTARADIRNDFSLS
jgi:hypothetical protein